MSPRLPPTLLWEIERLAHRDLSFADINRRVGSNASARGLPRPSYETVRLLVRAARERHAEARTLEVFGGVALRVCLPQVRRGRAAGFPLPRRK